MLVERITPHLLQGKILLQIEVSMPPDLLIRSLDSFKIMLMLLQFFYGNIHFSYINILTKLKNKSHFLKLLYNR